MNKLFPFLLLACGLQTLSSGQEIRQELPIGTTFSIKTDFWVYEIKGRPIYHKDNRYIMNSDRGGGPGDMKFKCRTTFPKGTRLEVVGLIKKNNRKWIYLAKTKDYTNPIVKENTVSISPLLMLAEPLGRRIKYVEQKTRTLQLTPDLFTDFIYPDN